MILCLHELKVTESRGEMWVKELNAHCEIESRSDLLEFRHCVIFPPKKSRNISNTKPVLHSLTIHFFHITQFANDIVYSKSNIPINNRQQFEIITQKLSLTFMGAWLMWFYFSSVFLSKYSAMSYVHQILGLHNFSTKHHLSLIVSCVRRLTWNFVFVCHIVATLQSAYVRNI